jgi:hypothetical protein
MKEVISTVKLLNSSKKLVLLETQKLYNDMMAVSEEAIKAGKTDDCAEDDSCIGIVTRG